MTEEPEWIDALENELKITQGSEFGAAFLAGYKEGMLRAFKISDDCFDEILKVVDAQKDDPMLWDDPETARENKLQGALSLLTARIEFELFGDDTEAGFFNGE